MPQIAQIAQIAQITPSANYGMVDNSNNTGEINGKTCSIIKSNDNGVTNLVRSKFDSFVKSISKLIEKIKNYCQTKLPESIRNLFSKGAVDDHTDVKEMPTDSISLVKKLSDSMSSEFKNFQSTEALHQEIIAQLNAIDEAANLETDNYCSYLKDVMKDDRLDAATQALSFEQKLDFLRYFKSESQGKKFCQNNWHEPDYKTLLTMMTLMEKQILKL